MNNFFTKYDVENNQILATLVDGINITFQDVADKMNSLEETIKESSSKPLLKTLAKFTVRRGGKVVKTFVTSNTAVLGGRARILEGWFGKKPVREMHLTQNELLEIPHSVDIFAESSNLYKDICIKGFCVGDGARNPQNIQQEFRANNSETKLYNIMPLRCVEETSDLSAEEQKKYRGRKKIALNGKNYILYYFKLVEADKISMEHEKANYVPKFSDTVAVPKDNAIDPETGLASPGQNIAGPNSSNSPVYIFTKMKIQIEANEFKEYYKLKNNNSLNDAGINEIGIIFGVDQINKQEGEAPRQELTDIEIAAKMTFPHQTMAAENISVSIEYIIYA